MSSVAVAPAGTAPADDGAQQRRDPWSALRCGWPAAVLLLAVAGLAALANDVFTVAIDETQHIGTAYAVSGGTILDVRDFYPSVLPGQDTGAAYTANHPPLFHLLAGLVLRVGLALDAGYAAVRAVRLLDVAMGAVVVLTTAGLARALVPSRPRVAVTAAGLVALVPVVQTSVAAFYTDALALAFVTGLLLVCVRVVLHGLSTASVAAAAALALGAAATRAAALITVATAVLAVACAAALEERPLAQRARRGLLAALAVGGVPALGIGWFYLLNVARYGDPVGQGGVAEVLTVGPTGRSLAATLVDPAIWWGYVLNLWGSPHRVVGPPRWLVVTLLLLVAVGAVVALVRAAVTRRRPPLRPAVAWGVVLLHGLVQAASVASYVTQGGAPYVRYLLPALPVVAVLAAGALCAGGRPRSARGAVVPVLGLLLAAAVTARMMVRYQLLERPAPDVLDSWTAGLAAAGVPAPGVLLVVLLAVAGVAVAVQAGLVVAARGPDDAEVEGRRAAGVARR